MSLSINQRLVTFQEKEKFSWEDLRKILGVRLSQQISNWSNLKEPIPPKYILKIIELFPDLNARWFITGEGSMIETGQSENEVKEGREKYGNENCLGCAGKQKRINELLEKNYELSCKYTSCMEQLMGKKGDDITGSA